MNSSHLRAFSLGALSVAFALLLAGAAQGPTQGPKHQLGTPSDEQLEFLSHVSIVYLDDGQGGTAKTVRISGVNLQLVNGLEATNGDPTQAGSVDPTFTQTNGVGNLLVGYNELPPGSFDRTGSHNLIVGIENEYPSFGGFAAGRQNEPVGAYASVTGATSNRASGEYSVVSGGDSNNAGARNTWIGGGWINHATAELASVAGGQSNVASGEFSSIAGGREGSASDDYATVAGGYQNTGSGPFSAVSGGQGNELAWSRPPGGSGTRRGTSPQRDSPPAGASHLHGVAGIKLS